MKRAVEVLSPDVTSALEFLKEQAGHGSHHLPIIFMKNLFRWLSKQLSTEKSAPFC